jgi:hypothetical protein
MIEISNTYLERETWKVGMNPHYVSQLVLLNAEGREIRKVANLASGESIDLTDLPAGIYSIRLSNPTEVQHIRIVKH